MKYLISFSPPQRKHYIQTPHSTYTQRFSNPKVRKFFSVKGHTVNILNFEGHIVSVIMLNFAITCTKNTAINNAKK